MLEPHGFEVREAQDAAHPDAIDGLALVVDLCEDCRTLKSHPATAAIPVLFVADAGAGTEAIVQALDSGAENCLAEPLEPEVLAAAVRSAMRVREGLEDVHALAREWQTTFAAISDGLAVADAAGIIRRSNQALATLVKRPIDELIGSPASSVWMELGSGEPPSAGDWRTVELVCGTQSLLAAVDPIYEENGALAGSVHIFRDITERRRLEEQFRESQKFETIGTLAGGVAHDFNNLLTSVIGNASLLLAGMPQDSPDRDKLLDIVKSSRRAADLTRQLLAYSGKARGFLEKVDLSTVVAGSRSLIEAAIPKKVRLDLALGSDLPFVDADPNQVQQVLLNLVSNSVEAIGEASGAITVRTAYEGGKVCLEVRDNGCGMDAATRARVFDPFFTTKFTGRGLGLSAVAGIVRGHKGSIDVESVLDEGSTFRITLPPVARPRGKKRAAAEDPKRSAMVLVVEDEELVLRLATTALEASGYRTTQAVNGLEAVEAVKRDAAIEVVLLDLMMPVMGGEEAVDLILQERPELKVIVSTGYDEGEAVARFQDKHVAGYLHKPYTAQMLVDKVKSVLRE
jgi:signal transduction histidine kinase/ActR/RegA family two-component response regulator